MPDAVIGKAYLQVVPKMDDGALKSSMTSAGSSGGATFSSSFQKGVSAKSVAIGNVISSALMKGVDMAAQAASEVVMGAFEGYAKYEQLSGGVKKIFDEMDYDRIARDAKAAYKTMGISANEYMQAMTTVGANFASTLGDERGYDVAKRGMQAISDFASGTGRSIDELNDKYQMITKSTSSYQSIADQFAGILPATSDGFLEAAKKAGILSDEYEKLTDVPMPEYQQAVTEMLVKGVDALGLSNNTWEESESTITGALDACKASWDNFLTSLGQSDREIEEAATALRDSLGNALNNVAKWAANAMRNVGRSIAKALGFSPDEADQMFADAKQWFSDLAVAAKPLVDALARFGEDALPIIRDTLKDMAPVMKDFGDTILPVLGGAFQALATFIDMNRVSFKLWHEATRPVRDALGGYLHDGFENLRNVVSTLGDAVDRLGGFFRSAASVALNAWASVADFFADFIQGASEAFAPIADALGIPFSQASDRAVNSLRTMASECRSKADAMTNDMKALDRIKFAVKNLKVTDNGTVSSIYERVRSLANQSLPSKTQYIYESGYSSVMDKLRWIREYQLPEKVQWVRTKISGMFGGDAAGGFLQMHAAGWITNGPTILGTDRYGVSHIVGEAGREWVMGHADGTASVVPIENRRYLEPYASTIASMIGAGGPTLVINGATVNSDAEIREQLYGLLTTLQRKGRM